jgi:Spy/CpxP family protein refolding chaperone
MTSHSLRRWRSALWLSALGLALVMGVARPADAQPPSPFVPGPWWKEFQKTLGITDDQSNRVEAVFQAALPYLRHKRDDLEAQEAELSRLIKADADEAAVAKQSDRIETIRGALNKSRTLMLVHMREILTPEQRLKLNTLREQWDRDHPPPPRGGSTPTTRPGDRRQGNR